MNWTRFLWLLVPVLGLVELGAHYAFAHRAPTQDEWQALRASVAELRRNDELVVIAPRWADPLARRAFGEGLMPLRDVARPDETGYPRALEVSALGARAPELRDWRILEERTSGNFRLRLLENPNPVRVRFDFVEGFGPERVRAFERTGTQERECPFNPQAHRDTGYLGGPPAFPARRFTCGGGDWFFVGITVIDDPEYRPRRCIWAQPVPNGAQLVRFTQVPLGTKIRGHAGVPWLILRDARGAPIELEVRVAGRSIGTYAYREDHGFEAFEFATGGQAGQTADVEFEVRSSAGGGARQFCFHADTR
jgi:hypothetical protein